MTEVTGREPTNPELQNIPAQEVRGRQEPLTEFDYAAFEQDVAAKLCEPVCRWCDNPVVEVDRCDKHGSHWVHAEGSYFSLQCQRCECWTGSHSSQTNCRYCNYLIGDNHLAELRN